MALIAVDFAVFRIAERFMNQELIDRLKNSPQLPSLPAIAIRALELARK